eukprot:jgi/Mesen1/3148/ME000184S02217
MAIAQLAASICVPAALSHGNPFRQTQAFRLGFSRLYPYTRCIGRRRNSRPLGMTINFSSSDGQLPEPENTSKFGLQAVRISLSWLGKNPLSCVQKPSLDDSNSGSEMATDSSSSVGIFVTALFGAALVFHLFSGPFPEAYAVTPYSQSQKELQLGLEDGRIRPCPSDLNPNCVSTTSNNAAYAVPWTIPDSSVSNAIRKLESAIVSTQKKVVILKSEDVPGGHYLSAEVDGLFGRDTLEFLIKGDTVLYRSMAKVIKYVYPFTTPIGDFDNQRRHLTAIENELEWALPGCDSAGCDYD